MSPRRRSKRRPRREKLVLLRGKDITFDNIMQMFRKLTGREPTPEEIEEARREWDDKSGPKQRKGGK